MKTEKPKNKKPLIYYYFVMLIALMAFNLFVTPMIQNQRIKEVGYSDLIAALDEKQVEEVQVDNQTGKIAYTIKDNKKNVFVTGIMPNDATLTAGTERGAVHGGHSAAEFLLNGYVDVAGADHHHPGRRPIVLKTAGEENGREHDDVREI